MKFKTTYITLLMLTISSGLFAMDSDPATRCKVLERAKGSSTVEGIRQTTDDGGTTFSKVGRAHYAGLRPDGTYWSFNDGVPSENQEESKAKYEQMEKEYEELEAKQQNKFLVKLIEEARKNKLGPKSATKRGNTSGPAAQEEYSAEAVVSGNGSGEETDTLPELPECIAMPGLRCVAVDMSVLEERAKKILERLKSDNNSGPAANEETQETEKLILELENALLKMNSK